MKTRVVFCVAMLAGGSAQPAALAQPSVAEDNIRQGNELRRKDLDPRALPLYQKAYDLEPSPRTAAQLGLVEGALGYWLSAERHLKEGLVSTRNPWVWRNRAKLRRALANVQASIGEVEISGGPPGAEVTVNGQRAGQLPLPAPVRVGEGVAQIALRAGGHKEATTTATVRGGQRVPVRIALERLPGKKTGVDGLLSDGISLRKQGDDARALPLFQQAHDLEPSPRTAAQLGLVEMALGRWVPAENHLSEALSFSGDDWIVRNGPQLRGAIASVRENIGEIEVTGGPPAAEVTVNGNPVGRLPLRAPARVAAGTAQVAVRASGYRDAATSAEVEGGKRVAVRIVLDPIR
jgi:tetratricopeptide (TPR) repeat protein